ncbi:hypothetical protein FOMPIDRAFT_58832, partial [Fomitopsis schrenkii]
IAAVRNTPTDAPLTLRFRASPLVKLLTEELTTLEDKGWIGVCGRAQIQNLVAEMRQRSAPTWLVNAKKGEKHDELNKLADAILRAADTDKMNIDFETSTDDFKLSGARLAVMTQALAYKGIRETKARTPRRGTEKNVERIMAYLEQKGVECTEAELWQSIRRRDVKRNVADFLWKSIHNGLRCGDFWEKIRGYEERAVCKICGETETLEHILTECDAVERRTIWRITEGIWKLKQYSEWKCPTMSIIQTACIQTKKKDRRKVRPGAERLWMILITESAKMIWNMRCERVIGHGDDGNWTHDETSVVNRWYANMNQRLRNDIAQTRKIHGRQARGTITVLNTWGGVLENEDCLPRDWTQHEEVLVGIRRKG